MQRKCAITVDAANLFQSLHIAFPTLTVAISNESCVFVHTKCYQYLTMEEVKLECPFHQG
jgi:hypothetical protein